MDDGISGQALTRADVQRLYERGRDDLFRLVWLVTGDAAAAEDVVQEAFTRLWHDPGRVNRPQRAEAYLRSIALNLIRSRATSLSRRRRLDLTRAADRSTADPFVNPSVAVDPAGGFDDRELFRRALDQLSPNQRICVVCRYWLDLSDAQVADATGMALGTVKTHLRRALAALRRSLPGDIDHRPAVRRPAIAPTEPGAAP